MIKSRNRVKAPSQAQQQQHQVVQQNGQAATSTVTAVKRAPGPGLAAAHPDVASNPHHYERFAQSPVDGHLAPPTVNQGYPAGVGGHGSQPGSRSTTPANIAPQSLFDQSIIENRHHSTPPPANGTPPGGAAPLAPMRAVSPGNVQLRAISPNHAQHEANVQSDEALSASALMKTNSELKTRVSELEVINDLFRNRVAELEAAERRERERANALNEEVKDLRGRGKRSRSNEEEAECAEKRLRLSPLTNGHASESNTAKS